MHLNPFILIECELEISHLNVICNFMVENIYIYIAKFFS